MSQSGDTRQEVIENVVELIVGPSGDHRLKTADGWLYIVAPGWISIRIKDRSKTEWTA